MIRRTLLVAPSFRPQVGGLERYLASLASVLDSRSLTIIAPPTPGDSDVDRRSPYPMIRRNLLSSRWLRPSWLAHLGWIFQLLRRTKIETIVFGGYSAAVGLGSITGWIMNIPMVVIVHGKDFLDYRVSAIRRAQLRWNLRRAEWVVANSRMTAELLYNFGVPRGKTIVVTPSVSPHRPASQAAKQLVARLLGSSSGPLFVTVARLVNRKNQSRIIRLLPRLLPSAPNLRYCVVGDGPDRQKIKTLVRQLGLESSVLITGRLSDDERSAIYERSTAFIMLPQHDRREIEGFGIVYAEAMAAGLPIIANTSAGIRELIHHGQNGYVIDESAGDDEVVRTMLNIVRDEPSAQQLGRQARADVQRLCSESAFADRWQTILRALPKPADRQPRVDIVIPAWNSERTLPRTLHSLSLQTYRNFSVTVVDDGSAQPLDSWRSTFPNVVFLRQEHRGAPTARNTGAAIGHAEFLLFLDADVTLHPRMIERMVATLDLHPTAGFVYASFRFGWRTFDLFDFDADRLRRTNYVSTMSLVRRSIFPGFDPTLRRLQDWDLWLTILEHGHRGVWVPARLFSASIARGGISRRAAQPPLDAMRIVKSKHHLEG